MKAARFQMRHVALLVAAIYAPHAFAAVAGNVEFSVGDAVIVGGDGRERPARKGEALATGERILTRTGRAQVAFTDGSFVSLQPNTNFGVDEYVFQGKNDGNEKSVFSLLTGALRTVTGLIGKGKRDAYTMKTPTATIGIRGTGGLISVTSEGTFVFGTSGSWSLSSQGGRMDVPAGRSAFVGKDANQAPQGTNNQPQAGPTPMQETTTLLPTTYSAGSQIGAVTTPVGMADGQYSVYFTDPSSGVPVASGTVASTFAGGVKLATFGPSSLGTGSVGEGGNDGVIGWGRWTNGTVVIEGSSYPLSANQGVHYVVGVPTAVMPTSGSATYTYIGGSNPTVLSGAYAPGSISGASFSVNFGTSTASYALTATVGGSSYSAANTSLALGAGATFTDSAPMFSGTACPVSCSGVVSGMFTGTSAERVGLTFKINSMITSQTVSGAAAFSK